MADLDLDAIAAIETEWDGYADDAWVTLTVPERDALVAEVRRLRAERDALADLIDAARDVIVHCGSVTVEGSELLDAQADALAALEAGRG